MSKGESSESLPAEPLPPSDTDLIAASRTGDAAAYATSYQRARRRPRPGLAARARPGQRHVYAARTGGLGRPVLGLAGGQPRAAIGLRGPGGTYRQVTGNAAGASVDLGHPGAARHPGIPVYQASPT